MKANSTSLGLAVYKYFLAIIRTRSPQQIAVCALGGIVAAWIVHQLLGVAIQLAGIAFCLYALYFLFNRLNNPSR